MDKKNTIIKHVYGNPLKLAIPLTQKIRRVIEGEETEEESDFYPNPNFPVTVTLSGGGIRKYSYNASVDGNVVAIEDKCTLRTGTYGVEVIAFDNNGDQVRYKANSVINIYDATIEAGIEAGVEFNVETYILEGAVFFYAKGDKGDKGDDGVGVSSVEQIQTSLESGGVNIVRVTLTNGVTSDFEIRNGNKPNIYVDGETLIIR